MGAMCSGRKQQKQQNPQQQIEEVKCEKQIPKYGNVLELWNQLNDLLNKLNTDVLNRKAQDILSNVLSQRKAIETLIVTQQKRQNRSSMLDPAFQYNVFERVDNIGKYLGDYLLIDQEFEEKNQKIIDKLSEIVVEIENQGKQFKTKLRYSKNNISTNQSNPNTSIK